MLRLVLLLLVSSVVNLLSARAADSDLLRVMSFNIRYGTAPDGEDAWPNRREFVFDVVRGANSDVIGFQEAMRFQLDELATALPRYSSVGVGREADGGGEYSAIFYDRTRFDVKQADTFWLSDSADQPGSKTWGNSLPRICSWAQLFDRTSGLSILVFNTHWDHQSQPSREHSGQLIRDRIENLNQDDIPVVLLGDFNVGQGNQAWASLLEAGLRDSFRDLYADVQGVGTFHAFQGETAGDKIDAVLVSHHWQVEAASIIRANKAGRYPSDHFPVTASLSLRKGPKSSEP